MFKSLVAAMAVIVAFAGTASAAPMKYNFDLTVGADSSAFGGLTAGDVFSGKVDLDPDFPGLTDGDGSLTNLLLNLNGTVFDQNTAASASFLSASTNFDTTPAPFFAGDPNGFVDILVRALAMLDGSQLFISASSSNDTTWQAIDSSSNRVAGSFTISAVPLPAALPFIVTALAGFGFMGARKRRTAA